MIAAAAAAARPEAAGRQRRSLNKIADDGRRLLLLYQRDQEWLAFLCLIHKLNGVEIVVFFYDSISIRSTNLYSTKCKFVRNGKKDVERPALTVKR
jgi:nanoRNase/pAp phosphatase (c-di-AMP/oligoRNAs hydrolase)